MILVQFITMICFQAAKDNNFIYFEQQFDYRVTLQLHTALSVFLKWLTQLDFLL